MEGPFRIGQWLVRPQLNTLASSGREVHIEPRAMQVLVCLAEHAGELVPKETLIREVWEETFVSDEALTYSIWELRKALGDDAKKPRYIQNVPKKGYRLIAAVASPRAASLIRTSRGRLVVAAGLAVAVSVLMSYFILRTDVTTIPEIDGIRFAPSVVARQPQTPLLAQKRYFSSRSRVGEIPGDSIDFAG